MERMHEGILYQDQYKRYCLYEPDVPSYKRLTCTSGCRLEVWLNRAWIAGHVEGDGEDYWLFADSGGRFLLAQHMKAHYREHHWRTWHQRHFQYLRLTFHTHYHYVQRLSPLFVERGKAGEDGGDVLSQAMGPAVDALGGLAAFAGESAWFHDLVNIGRQSSNHWNDDIW